MILTRHLFLLVFLLEVMIKYEHFFSVKFHERQTLRLTE